MININIIYESIIMGFITYIVGLIIFNMSFKNKKEDTKPKGLNLVFFLTGVFLHIIIELIGFSRDVC